MDLITKRTNPINLWIKEHLKRDTEIVIAVAYFNPDQKTKDRLTKARKTKLIVSGEFGINNPHLLYELSSAIDVKIVAPEAGSGRLHAKVIICSSGDGHRAALVGSANFTYHGLFIHDEAGIAFDSDNYADRNIIDGLERWIEELPGEVPDWDRAFRIWSRAQKSHRFGSPSTSWNKCWVLKTSEGPNGSSHWNDFKDEGVLAIGWRDLKVNPLHATKLELKKELNHHAAAQVWDFVHEWQPGDLVLICRGYTPKQESDVYLFGYAQVKPGLYYDENPSWAWRLKWPAEIKVVEQYLPKNLFVETLENGSLLRTIHKLKIGNFKNFTLRAQQEYGIPSPVAQPAD